MSVLKLHICLKAETRRTKMEQVNKIVMEFLDKNDLNDFRDDWMSNELQLKLAGLTDTSTSKGGKAEKKPKKPQKSPNAPKRARSAYILFSSDERPNIPSDLCSTAVIKELASRWEKLKTSDHDAVKQYQKLADAEKEHYAEKKEAYDKKKAAEK